LRSANQDADVPSFDCAKDNTMKNSNKTAGTFELVGEIIVSMPSTKIAYSNTIRSLIASAMKKFS
jgi:hypothetical protein